MQGEKAVAHCNFLASSTQFFRDAFSGKIRNGSYQRESNFLPKHKLYLILKQLEGQVENGQANLAPERISSLIIV